MSLGLIIRREVKLGLAGGAASAAPVAFFLIVAILFPFAVGPAPQVLARIAAGVVWVSALLACLLSMERLYQADAEDGSLEQYATTGVSMLELAAAKLASHWLLTAVPLLLATPIAALLLQTPLDSLGWLMLGLMIGTPALSALAGVAAALTVGLKRGGAVLAGLLVLPLTLPVLIFGVALPDPLAGASALKLLAASSLFLTALGPFAAAAALKLALE
jgi:heme exporter protein B